VSQSRASRVAASNLRVDAATAEVLRAFEAAGVQSILLKGPSIVRWLYDKLEARAYGDCDLLVRSRDVAVARRVLEELSFHPTVREEDMPNWWREHAVEWVRTGDGASVDLHRNLAGVGADDDRLWEALSAHGETLVVAGYAARTLDVVARAFHLALHTAQHGAVGRGAVDLERALQTVDVEQWAEAAALAASVDATAAFATGLRLSPAGAVVVDELRLPATQPVDVALRAASAPPVALGFDQLARARDLRERLTILRYKIAPPPTFMRRWSPEARQGRLGLARAYVRRPLWLLRRAPGGLRAWRAARRAARARNEV
jgi:hypothetical protein